MGPIDESQGVRKAILSRIPRISTAVDGQPCPQGGRHHSPSKLRLLGKADGHCKAWRLSMPVRPHARPARGAVQSRKSVQAQRRPGAASPRRDRTALRNKAMECTACSHVRAIHSARPLNLEKARRNSTYIYAACPGLAPIARDDQMRQATMKDGVRVQAMEGSWVKRTSRLEVRRRNKRLQSARGDCSDENWSVR